MAQTPSVDPSEAVGPSTLGATDPVVNGILFNRYFRRWRRCVASPEFGCFNPVCPSSPYQFASFCRWCTCVKTVNVKRCVNLRTSVISHSYSSPTILIAAPRSQGYQTVALRLQASLFGLSNQGPVGPRQMKIRTSWDG